MRQPARRRPSYTPRSPRHRPAQAHAPSRARVADPRAQRLTSTPPQKCSGDFFAKALICLAPPPEFAQVGLERWSLSRVLRLGCRISGPVARRGVEMPFLASSLGGLI